MPQELKQAPFLMPSVSDGASGIHRTGSGKKTILMLEPNRARLAERISMLSEANYEVMPIESLRELFEARRVVLPGVVMLSDTLGHFALRAAAEAVRMQWQEARLLILGAASAMLDDNMYDVAVRQRAQDSELLSALDAMMKHRAIPIAVPGRVPYRSSASLSGLSESDPTKTLRKESKSSDRQVPASVLR